MKLSDDERKAIEVACESISRDERCGPVGLGALCVLQDLLTHPEASAPGLSDGERKEIETACRSKLVKMGDDYALGADALAKQILAILTRASAATVAEPKDWTADECVATGQTCNYGPHGRHGETQCKYCGAKAAAQQQAEPVPRHKPRKIVLDDDEQAEPGADERAVLSKDAIRDVFLSHGFTVKEGQTDLKPYVYGAAYALLDRAAQSGQRAGVVEAE